MERKTYCGKWYGADREITENARYRLWNGGMCGTIVKYFQTEEAANSAFDLLSPTQKAVSTVEKLED